MFNKVLILSASAGAGHVRAAEALVHAFSQLGAAREIFHIDALEYTTRAFRKIYANAYIEMANKSPEVLGWFYDQLDKPWQGERRRLAFDKLNSSLLIKMLQRHKPDIAVSTHFLSAEIISWLRAKGKISCRQAIVVTDMDVHAMWLCHHFERYFVPIDETREHLFQLGIPADKITVSGIPIDPVFSTDKSQMEMREKYGLYQDRIGILLSAGGFGVGPMEHLIESLKKLRHPAQVIAMCGRNEELRHRISEIAPAPPDDHVAIKAVGFTTDMDEYMTASDIVVGKPGGLTTSEAMAKGLVMVIVNPIPGQEERNSDHLLEEGVAIRCNNLPALAYKIDALLDDRERFSLMKQKVRAFARPNAAMDIVRQLLADRAEGREIGEGLGDMRGERGEGKGGRGKK